jgi:hypothetical protein
VRNAETWEVLRDAGVPDGAIRPRGTGPLDARSVARALREAVLKGQPLETSEAECLAAWLGAFSHHWPDRFIAILGDAGHEALAHLRNAVLDPNRYLKLRRIAIENLACRV